MQWVRSSESLVFQALQSGNGLVMRGLAVFDGSINQGEDLLYVF